MTETKDYPNSGRFFVNDKMRPEKKDPNYNGDGEITCQHCGQKNKGWINIWSKVGAKGDWWSWSFKHKEARQDNAGSSSGGGSLGRSLSSGSQQDMGYSRDLSPRDAERAQRGERRDFGKDIDDGIPF